MSMPQITIVFGLALIAIGLTAYFGSDLEFKETESKKTDSQTTNSTSEPAADGDTADVDDSKSKKKRSAITGLAIPGAFGLLLLISGAVALKESARKHAMHVAVMVGTLGAVATIGKGGFDLVKLNSGQEINLRALSFVLMMAAVCTVFVVMCIKSFIAARKQRELDEATPEATDA